MPSAAHQILEELDEDTLKERLAAVLSGSTPSDDRVAEHYGVNMAAARASEPESDNYRWYRPLGDAAGEYVAFAQTPHDRVYLGIDAFDAAMRGLAPGEMLLITGFAANGKTLLTSEFVLNNRKKRIAWITPDETRVLVLVKLVSLWHGVSAEVLENRIADGDETAVEMVRSTAREHFPKLAVFDQGMTIEQMHVALNEAEEVWEDKCQAVIFDYAGLLAGFDDVRGAIGALKAFGKARHVPMVVLHQSSRSGGADGKAVTMTSGAYGGEQEATFLIGVRRKKNELIAQINDLRLRIRTGSRDTSTLQEMLTDCEYALTKHQRTVTVSLLKSKRPPSRLVDEVDFELDVDTGRIRELGHDLVDNLENRGVTWDQQEF